MPNPIHFEILNIDGSVMGEAHIKWNQNWRDASGQRCIDQTMKAFDIKVDIPGKDPRCPYQLRAVKEFGYDGE